MPGRLTSGALLLAAVLLPVVGCTSSQVDTLQVTPATVAMSPGATAQLTAIGVYHHGSGPSTTQNLTSQVTWNTTSADVATVSAAGVVTGVGAGTVTITATINGYTGLLSASSSVTVTASGTGGGGGTGSDVVSVSIIPGAQSVAVAGETGQFIAIGTTSGGNQVNLTDSATWTSSNVSVATVSSHGLATAIGAGTTTITAIATNSDQTVASGTATFTVTGANAGPLLSISLIPNAQTMIAGQTSQLIAIGTFNTSPSTQNVTGSVTWATSNAAVASVSASGGLVTAVGPGVCVITGIATNPGGGVVTATSTFTVTGSSSSAEPLASLAIVPNSQTALAVNQTAHFIAIATTGTGNTVNLTGQSASAGGATIAAAVWSSSNPTVATIDPATGIATALSAGTTAITAQASNPDGTVVLATATFTVTIPTVAEPLVSLAILPATQTLAAAGQTANLTAVATTGSGTTVNLTNKTALVGTTTIQAAVWASSAPSVASVDPATGIVTANGSGVAVITAIASNPDKTVVTATATITSTAVSTTSSAIASIDVIPGGQSVASPNDTTQFLAIGTTTTGATENITTQVTWSSSSAQIATIGAGTGYATAAGKGTATITAIYSPANGNVVTGTATFTVTGGTVEEYVAPLTILPNSQTIGSGVTGQFIALATRGSDGQVVDVTDSKDLTWSVSNSGIATVSTYPAVHDGIVTGHSAGTTTVTAELANSDTSVITATASLTVTTAPPPESILTLTIYPSTITVLDFNLTGQFLAIGTFSEAPYVRDLTNAPTTTWVSSEPESFPVGQSSQGSGGNNGASAGLVTAYASGGADIIAESTSEDGTIQVAQATFNCPEVLPNGLSSTPSCYPDEPPAAELLATLTVFNEGLNTTDWEVTAPSATGTANVIHCGPGWALNGGAGGSVCTGTYPMDAKTPAGTKGVVLKAQGGAFGGWSYNCAPSDSQGNLLAAGTWTAAGPNYCVASLDSSYIDDNGNVVVVPGIDTTIGAIFN